MQRRILPGQKQIPRQKESRQEFRHAKAALMFEMITGDEYDEILKGNMALTDSLLINVNVDNKSHKTPLLVGETVLVHHDRAKDVMIRKLLGEW